MSISDKIAKQLARIHKDDTLLQQHIEAQRRLWEIEKAGLQLGVQEQIDGKARFAYEFDHKSYWEFVQESKGHPFSPSATSSRTRYDDYEDHEKGTNTFEEAIQLAENGWGEIFESEVEIQKQFDSFFKPAEGQTYINDVQGSIPDVEAYCLGQPEDMIAFEMRDINKKILNIGVNLSAAWTVSASLIQRRGIVICKLIDYLESFGYQCNLTGFFINGGEGIEPISGNQEEIQIMTRVNLKTPGCVLTTDIIKFALCNSAFMRRLFFSFKESNPIYYERFLKFDESGYGRPMSFGSYGKEEFDILFDKIDHDDDIDDVFKRVKEELKQLDIIDNDRDS